MFIFPFLLSGFREKFLQKAAVRIVNTTVCSSLMEDQITDRMLCAGVLEGGVDACQVQTPDLTTAMCIHPYVKAVPTFQVHSLKKGRQNGKNTAR